MLFSEGRGRCNALGEIKVTFKNRKSWNKDQGSFL